jgi:hypothetical protein
VVENIVTYPLTLKIDPGSKTTGISLVNNRDEVIWGMELEHRGQQIKFQAAPIVQNTVENR